MDAIALLDEREAAARLKVALRTVQGWRTRGGGPPFLRLGRGRGAIRYRPEDLEAYLAGRVRTSTSDDGQGAGR